MVKIELISHLFIFRFAPKLELFQTLPVKDAALMLFDNSHLIFIGDKSKFNRDWVVSVSKTS